MNKDRLRIFLAVAVVTTAAISIAAQDQPRDQEVATPQSSQVQANELFNIDVKEKRITEKDYRASTALEIGSKDPNVMRVQVGVALYAQTIDVVLYNVAGSVRFRGTLQRIVDVLKARSPR
jgi:hypothetical protein